MQDQSFTQAIVAQPILCYQFTNQYQNYNYGIADTFWAKNSTAEVQYI